MLQSRHRIRTARPTHGFSLIELSVVIAILAVVATFGLEAAANFVNKTAGTVSKERLAVADNAIVQFFRIYGRLPCPAAIATAPSSSSYGAEDCTIAEWGTDAEYTVKIGGGILYGGLPFRALNLPMAYALDGFNNKLNYAVTKNLTVAGGTAAVGQSGRFGAYDGTNATTIAASGIGGIEIRSGVLEQPCATTKCQILANPATTPPAGAAYIIFSNGADQRGAYSARGDIRNGTTIVNSCMPLTASYASRVDTQNCQYGANANTTSVTTIPKNVFYDNRTNAGYNLTSYFDDYVVWRTKAGL